MQDLHLTSPAVDRNWGVIKIVGLYLLLGVLWILFSDRLAVALVSDPAALIRVSMLKGWGYIMVTALLLYELIRRHTAALRHSEERFAKAFHANPAAVTLTRLTDAVIIDANESYQRIFGYHRDEVIGRTAYDLNVLTFSTTLQDLIRRLQETSSRHDYEISLRAKSGEILDLLISNETIEIDHTPCVISIMVDITQRKRAEKALREQEEQLHRLNEELEQRVAVRTAQLEAANQELEAFAYSVSHDLRAPLRAINGYTGILIEEYEPILDDEGRRICAVVQNEAQRMGQLIDDLLAFSRLSRAPLQSCPIHMDRLATAVFHSITTPKERERLEFHSDLLSPAVGDPSLIRQVWHNLLANAIKFSANQERALIEISSSQQGEENIYAVRDNGAGFDPRYVDKLFGVFQRLHSEREFEGTGVGLAIVQRIIHRHGGRVWAEGQVGHGACFYFTLPPSVTAEDDINEL